MKRKTCLILMFMVASFGVINVDAQDANSSINEYNKSKFHVILDFHYLAGLSENGVGSNLSQSNMYATTLHLMALYSILPNCAVGAGIGANRYENPGFNSFPIYATIHYSPLKKYLDAYIYSNVGASFRIGADDPLLYDTDIHVGELSSYTTSLGLPGLMADLGVGYKLMLKKHFGFNFQLGYNLKQYPYQLNTVAVECSGKRYRNSLAFGFGLIF